MVHIRRSHSNELIFESMGASLAGLLSLKRDNFTEDLVGFFSARLIVYNHHYVIAIR